MGGLGIFIAELACITTPHQYNKMASRGVICQVLSDSKGSLLVEFDNVTVLSKVSGIHTVYIVINSPCIVYRDTSSH